MKDTERPAGIGRSGLRVVLASGLLVAALGATACGGDSSNSATDQAQQQVQDQANQLKDQATESVKTDASEAVNQAADKAQQAINQASP